MHFPGPGSASLSKTVSPEGASCAPLSPRLTRTRHRPAQEEKRREAELSFAEELKKREEAAQRAFEASEVRTPVDATQTFLPTERCAGGITSTLDI